MLLINADRKEDIIVFEAIAERLGLKFVKLTDKDERFFARQKLVNITDSADAHEISDAEISDVIETIRANRYAKKQN